MGRLLVQSPKSHPGISKDLYLANTPAQFKRHATYCRNIPSVYFSSSRLKNLLLVGDAVAHHSRRGALKQLIQRWNLRGRLTDKDR